VLYVAVAEAGDAEMAARIRAHQQRRPPTWRTLEAPREVALQTSRALRDGGTVLVEDLTLLLANLLPTSDAAPAAEQAALAELAALTSLPVDVILVSNEVGQGLVPAFPLGRAFRDALGRLNQAAAAAADEAYLLVAGIPLRLK
jgi:adenosylcobinamide kinase/adenosylcobinamide-phosphate guanylyltransferase